jgi:Xaa-Pro dipeptidase
MDLLTNIQTRTFPISGKFSTESRAIYDIVAKMQDVCTNMLKEGIVWDDVHLTAHKIAIEGLLALGIFKGDKDAILKARTSVAFFPHGLGHYLGMDTHDTGGHPDYEDKDTMFRYLRVRGKLPAGSIITVEPGVRCLILSSLVYKLLTDSRFTSAALSLSRTSKTRLKLPISIPKFSISIGKWAESALKVGFPVSSLIAVLTSRIDNILITKSGYDNLTTAVKDVAQMEKIINGS